MRLPMKRNCWFFLTSLIFKLSKHENMSSSPFFRLIKTWSHRTPSSWHYSSSSFLGLVKCTRLNFSKGINYITSICYPLQACFQKITGVLARNGGGKWNQDCSQVGSMSLLNMALVCICVGVGTSHFTIFSSMGLGNLFWPLICSFPHHHDLGSFDVKYYRIQCCATDMFKRSLPLQLSTFLWSPIGPDPLSPCSSISC